MSDGIYVGMAGAAARAAQLDGIADNLANAQTPGYKAAHPAFQTFLPASGADDKAYPVAVAAGFDMSEGDSLRTGEALDVRPPKGAFLGVRLPGGFGYTRDGRLSVDAEGLLSAASFPVLNKDQEPIRVPLGATVAVRPTGEVEANGVVVAELGLWELEGPQNRVKAALFSPAPGGGARPTDGELRIGELENSNAKPLDAAIQMVQAQRNFETSMQALQTYRRMDERASELGKVR